MGVEGSNVRY